MPEGRDGLSVLVQGAWCFRRQVALREEVEMAAHRRLLGSTESLLVVWVTALFVGVFGGDLVSERAVASAVSGGPLAGATISGAVGTGLNTGGPLAAATISGAVGAGLGSSEGQPDT